MLAKTLFFQDETEFAAFISQARQSLASLSEVKFTVQESSGQVTALETGHQKISGDNLINLQYRLEKNAESSANPWALKIAYYQIQKDQSSKRFEQDFTIKSNCEMQWVQSSWRDEQSVSKSTYEVVYVDRYVDGSREQKKKSFENPKGLPISELLFYGEDFFLHPLEFALFDPEIGFVLAQSEVGSKKNVEKFGLSMQMETKAAHILSDNVEIASVEAKFSSEYAISNYEMGANEYWFVPKAIWEQQVLGGGDFQETLIQVNLPENYLYQNSSYIVVGNEIPTYEHLSAYLLVNEIDADAQSGEKKFVFTESLQTYDDQAIPEDLESNDIIQLDDPEVQQLAKQFSRQAPHDRTGQIKLLLEYLEKNYPYDHSMVTNNIVRALSVREALDRKTGVCQHFAIIFTAVARAMGIPSRVIVGFHLSDKGVGGHSWVETEVKPGTWQVIEPQSANGLTETYTRFYIPITRARFLETKSDSASYAKWAAANINLKMKIEPND